MQNVSIYARLSCTVSYADGTSENFASTIYEEGLDVSGNSEVLGHLIAHGYFNKAIQNINKNVNFYYSGVTDKRISDCSILISGNITQYSRRRTLSNIFGVYGDKNHVHNFGENFDAKPVFASLIKQWIDSLLEGR